MRHDQKILMEQEKSSLGLTLVERLKIVRKSAMRGRDALDSNLLKVGANKGNVSPIPAVKTISGMTKTAMQNFQFGALA